MRFVVQRVTHASVTVDSQVIGKIGNGFMVLIGVADTDTREIADGWDVMAGTYDFSDFVMKSDIQFLTEDEINAICVL